MNSSPASPSTSADLVWNDTLPAPRDLGLEVQRLCQDGEADPVGVILSRYPELRADRRLVLDLIFEEYLYRKNAGNMADAGEFCRRFPGFERSLRGLMVGHSFVEARPDVVAKCPDLPRFQPTDQLLGFYVLRELGRGAFGQVLLATEPALGNRLVAVKVSNHGRAEARTLGRLVHPNIVPVYSAQEDHTGLQVVCMPYLGTATLNDVLDYIRLQGKLPTKAGVIWESVQNRVTVRYPPSHRETPDRVFGRGTYIDGVLHIAVQLAEALAFVHARGICHRDLKPSNVLMTPDGRPMLLDFNLSLNKCATGEPAGTPTYMPPEQLRALDPNNHSDQPSLIDERSDLFSLGVILYELLTGTHPFEPIPIELSARELLPLLLAKQQQGFPPIRQLNPRVEKTLAETVERCLAFHAKDRPQPAAELVAAFRRLLSHFHRVRRWAALHKSLLTVATACGFAVLSVSAYCLIPSEPYRIRQLHKGLDRYHRGQYDEAIQYLSQAVEADRESVEARFARARAFQRRGRIESALADYEKADELADQQDGRIKASIGYCSSLCGDHEKAILLHREAMQLSFVTAELCNNLGYNLLQSRPKLKADDILDQTQHWLDKAIELNGGLQPAYYNRAILDIKRTGANPQRIPKRGLADIRKAIELGPVTAPLLVDAARLCVLNSKTDPAIVTEALGYLEKAIELGLPPKEVETDFLFRDLKNNSGFQSLLKKSSHPESFQKPVQLVNPIMD